VVVVVGDVEKVDEDLVAGMDVNVKRASQHFEEYTL
jgi:hypothetical protein